MVEYATYSLVVFLNDDSEIKSFDLVPSKWLLYSGNKYSFFLHLLVHTRQHNAFNKLVQDMRPIPWLNYYQPYIYYYYYQTLSSRNLLGL